MATTDRARPMGPEGRTQPAEGVREECVLGALEPNANVAELCREYGVSRKTGYWSPMSGRRISTADRLAPRNSPRKVSGSG
jgi:transposase-like protein